MFQWCDHTKSEFASHLFPFAESKKLRRDAASCSVWPGLKAENVCPFFELLFAALFHAQMRLIFVLVLHVQTKTAQHLMFSLWTDAQGFLSSVLSAGDLTRKASQRRKWIPLPPECQKPPLARSSRQRMNWPSHPFPIFGNALCEIWHSCKGFMSQSRSWSRRLEI